MEHECLMILKDFFSFLKLLVEIVDKESIHLLLLV